MGKTGATMAFVGLLALEDLGLRGQGWQKIGHQMPPYKRQMLRLQQSLAS